MNSSTTAGHARIRSAAPKSHTNRTESWAFPNAHDAISPAKTSLRHRKSGVRTKNWGNRTHQNQQPLPAFVEARGRGGSGCANINVLTRVPGKARSIPFCGKTGARENRHKRVIMSTSENVETAKNGFAAFAAGDLEAVLSIFDDDIEFVLPGNRAVSGTYRGKAEVTEFFAKLAEQSFTTTPNRFVADGDVVVVLTQVRRGIRNPSRCDHLPRWQSRQSPELGGHSLQERVFGTK